MDNRSRRAVTGARVGQYTSIIVISWYWFMHDYQYPALSTYRPFAVGGNFRYISVSFCMLSAMLMHHKCTVTIEENAFLQCFAATQAASAIWLANSISTCIHIIIQKSWRANCLRSCTALQKRVFLNRHCTFVVHQHGRQHAEVLRKYSRSYRLLQTVYTEHWILNITAVYCTRCA